MNTEDLVPCGFQGTGKKTETLLRRITPAPFLQRVSIVMPELGRLFRCEILFLVCVQVLFHLLHDMLGLMVILDIQVCRGLGNLMGMATLRAEFPLLETIHVGERAARRAPDNEVHDNEVMRVIVIKIYRREGWKAIIMLSLHFLRYPEIPGPPGKKISHRTLKRQSGFIKKPQRGEETIGFLRLRSKPGRFPHDSGRKASGSFPVSSLMRLDKSKPLYRPVVP
jgi:hypothetical protein